MNFHIMVTEDKCPEKCKPGIQCESLCEGDYDLCHNVVQTFQEVYVCAFCKRLCKRCCRRKDEYSRYRMLLDEFVGMDEKMEDS